MTMSTIEKHPEPTLPVQPLIRFIEGRGGFKAQFPVQRKFCPRGPDGDGFIRESLAPEFSRRFRRQQKWLSRATLEGHGMIPLSQADAIICDTLNLHPFDVYGRAYFDLP